MSNEPFTILPAEWFGSAEAGDGILNIGGIKLPYTETCCGHVDVYVRRFSDDKSIAEIHIARHDGLAQEELDRQNEEAAQYPQGPKEYWRLEMVGKGLMTNEEFEDDWEEDDPDE